MFVDYEAYLLNFADLGKKMLHTGILPKDWEKLTGDNGVKLINAILEIKGVEQAIIAEHTLEIKRKDNAKWGDILPQIRKKMWQIYNVEVRQSPWYVRLDRWMARLANG
jgi:hypothetical protein